MRLLLPFLFLLIGLTACGPATEATVESPSTPPTSEEEVLPESPATTDFDAAAYRERLNGTWNRTSYPHGSITFEGNQIKYDVGEGNAEPASFQAYELNKNCPYGQDGKMAEGNEFYVVTAKRDACDKYILEGDRLQLLSPGTSEAVVYERAQRGE